MYFVVYILHVWCGAFVVGVFSLTIRFYQHLFWLMCVNFILLCRVATVNKRQKLTATCFLPTQVFSFWNESPP